MRDVRNSGKRSSRRLSAIHVIALSCTVVMLILKVSGAVSINWWFVFLPIIVAIALEIALTVIAVLIIYAAAQAKRRIDDDDSDDDEG